MQAIWPRSLMRISDVGASPATSRIVYLRARTRRPRSAPMDHGYVIALDTHCAFTEAVVMTATGRVRQRARVATTLAELQRLIEGVRRPRYVVLEEGPLADWLVRGLRAVADGVTACDARRN